MLMKKLIFVSAWMALLLLAPFGKTSLMGQVASNYSILQPPYPAALGEVLSKDSIPTDSLEAVVELSRIGKQDLKVAFLPDRIYLIFDLTGIREVYVMGYLESFDSYQGELSSNGILPTKLNGEELVNCLLKYYMR